MCPRGGADLLAVEVGVSLEGSSRASEGEHGEWHWDGNIDPYLTNIDLRLEFPGHSSRSGEDGSPVSIGIGVNDLDSLVNHMYITRGSHVHHT